MSRCGPSSLTRTRARAAILDLTGLEVVDLAGAVRLGALLHAVNLIGASAFVCGIRPAAVSRALLKF